MFEGQERTVLLVEDEAIIAMNEKMILEKRGLHVQVAHTADTAFNTANTSKHIDLVLMDIDLGNGMDGTEVASRILEKSERKYRTMVDTAPMPFQSLDEDGCLVDVNRAWLDTLGYTREEILGTWFGDLLSPENSRTRCVFFRWCS